MSGVKYHFKEEPRGQCTFCGEEKECVVVDYEGQALFFFPTQERVSICETCLSKMFRLLKKEY